MQVAPIVDKVRTEGDAAVREFTLKFDKVNLDSVCVRIEVSAGMQFTHTRSALTVPSLLEFKKIRAPTWATSSTL